MQDVTYRRAATIQEAVQLLKDNGPTARVLAGGTDIIVMARERRRDTSMFVDIKAIPELTGIRFDANEGLTLGAATPLYQIYRDETIQRLYPCLVDSASLIGGTAIQGRASFGGNLCNAGPAADSIPSLIALEGKARIVGANGERTVAVEDFCTAPGRNVLEPGEILVSLSFPAPQPNSGARFLRFIPRNEMDIAVVNCATNLRFEGDTVAAARISIGAVAPTPLFFPLRAPPSSASRSRMSPSRPPPTRPVTPPPRSMTCAAQCASASTLRTSSPSGPSATRSAALVAKRWSTKP